MEDFTQRMSSYALYTPSAQTGAAEAILKADLQVPAELLDAGFTARSLDYYWPQNGLWHYPYLLATAGHFKNTTRPNVVSNRSQGTVLVGDSSGFNLGHGSMPETKSWMKYADRPEEIMRLFRESTIKQDVLHWLENNSDVGLSLDVPLWCKGLPKSPFRNLSDQQLLTLSVENLEYFQQEKGKYRDVKYLSVLQGTTEAVEETWFSAVQGFEFNGYAFAGHVGQMGGIYRVLRRLLLLRDLGLLNAPLNNIHILRLSRPRWAPVLTAIQRAVRETQNKDFTITYDSSSPYKVAGMTSQYASLTHYGSTFKKGWAIKTHKAPLGYGLGNMEDPFALHLGHPTHMPVPMNSPIAQLLSVRDLNRNAKKQAIRTIDAFGDAVLVNHNCYVYTKAMLLANEAVFNEQPTAPERMMRAVKVIGQLFRAKNWAAMLDDNRALLASVVGDKKGT